MMQPRPEFLRGADTRGVRLQLEYLEAELALKKAGVRHTVAVFGSTRTPLSDRHYEEARRFGALVARAGGTLVTGGGPGIMEAANRGAFEAGGVSIGLNIRLPREQKPNAWLTPGLCLTFRYFALRKLHFMLRARAMVAFPGGYGTLDELFETLTLVQCGKVRPMPIVLVGRSHWRRAVDFGFLLRAGMIGRRDAKLFRFADSAREIWRAVSPALPSRAPAAPARKRS